MRDAGGVITYGTSVAETWRRLPAMVDRILKGTKPGEIPVEFVTRRELVFNLQKANDIGVVNPQELLAEVKSSDEQTATRTPGAAGRLLTGEIRSSPRNTHSLRCLDLCPPGPAQVRDISGNWSETYPTRAAAGRCSTGAEIGARGSDSAKRG